MNTISFKGKIYGIALRERSLNGCIGCAFEFRANDCMRGENGTLRDETAPMYNCDDDYIFVEVK